LGNKLQIVQSVYNTNQTVDEPWHILVAYELPDKSRGKFLLSQASQTVALDHRLNATEWFKLNRDSSGYYIVNYQLNNWKLLIAQLQKNHIVFSIGDCANLLFDAIQLSHKSLLSYETLFSLFDYLKNEKEYLPWSVASSALASLRSKLSSTNNFALVQLDAYIRQLIQRIYKTKVNLADDQVNKTYHQM